MDSLTVEHWYFYPLAAMLIACAIGVVSARNPLHGVLFLVSGFFFLAGIYLLLAAQLVAAVQIIVYAGAIMVLFLFVIMLLALSDEDLGPRKVTAFKIVGGAFSVAVVGLALKAFGLRWGANTEMAGREVPRLILWLRELPSVRLPDDFGSVSAVGHALFTENVLQFETVSLLLLVAIVGAVVVAKARI